jgi:ABC-type polysaccharide/polyol phosphate export permease
MVPKAWFWLTPIAYPISLIPDDYLFLYKLNPMALFVIVYRQVLMGGVLPSLKYGLVILLVTLGSLGLGYLPFLRIRGRLAEEV